MARTTGFASLRSSVRSRCTPLARAGPVALRSRSGRAGSRLTFDRRAAHWVRQGRKPRPATSLGGLALFWHSIRHVPAVRLASARMASRSFAASTSPGGFRSSVRVARRSCPAQLASAHDEPSHRQNKKEPTEASAHNGCSWECLPGATRPNMRWHHRRARRGEQRMARIEHAAIQDDCGREQNRFHHDASGSRGSKG